MQAQAWASGPRPPPPARPRRRRGRGPWRTRVAVASWSPSRAAAATASRSRCPAGAGPCGSGGMAGPERRCRGAARWPDAPEAAQGLLAGRLRLDPGAGTRQDLSGPPGPGQGDHGVRACPVAVADGGAGHHQVLEAAPGDVPGFALAGLLHRAGLDPGPLPDPGRAVPGRPLAGSSRQVCSTTLTTPAARSRVSGSGMAWRSRPPEQAPTRRRCWASSPSPSADWARQVEGAAGVPDPLDELDGGLAAPGDGRELVEDQGGVLAARGACGGWRSGRSPPATAACRHRRPRGRPGRGRGGRRSRRPRTIQPAGPASKPPAVAAKKLANRPTAPLTARAWSRPTRLSASRRRSGSCSYSRTSSSGSIRAMQLLGAADGAVLPGRVQGQAEQEAGDVLVVGLGPAEHGHAAGCGWRPGCRASRPWAARATGRRGRGGCPTGSRPGRARRSRGRCLCRR